MAIDLRTFTIDTALLASTVDVHTGIVDRLEIFNEKIHSEEQSSIIRLGKHIPSIRFQTTLFNHLDNLHQIDSMSCDLFLPNRLDEHTSISNTTAGGQSLVRDDDDKDNDDDDNVSVYRTRL